MISPHSKKPLFSFSHANRLLIGCQHIDKLLGEIEGILHESSSNTAFPRYLSDLSPSQSSCIEDYVSLIRTRLLSIVESSDIEMDKPDIPASRAVRVRLASIQVSVDELRPKAMRSYGPMEHEAENYLSGIVNELRALVTQVDQFLTGAAGQNFSERLRALEQGSYDISHLKKIEECITRNGLVEFRPALASILDQVEEQTFEIAVFGRVSSGKSSLLNAILGDNILPVGVTPVTALPIHIRWGKDPIIEVFFVDKKPMTSHIADLPLYASEQHNPSNTLHVSKIMVFVPSARLQNKVGFVDTPGLGSLATAGAAETYAYLPRCDLGLVLIDASSTLTPEDIHTILTLQQAAIPVQILVSKADLLSLADQSSLIEYISNQMYSRCNERYPIHPVSIQNTHRDLLSRWYDTCMLPLIHQAHEMKARSLQRKIGTLWESVQLTLDKQKKVSETLSPERRKELLGIETALRKGSARIEQFRTQYSKPNAVKSPKISPLWTILAKNITEYISKTSEKNNHYDLLVKDIIVQYVHDEMKSTFRELSDLASDLHNILVACAEILNSHEGAEPDDLIDRIRNVPLFDPGPCECCLSLPPFSSVLGESYIENSLKKQIKEDLKVPLTHSFEMYTQHYGKWILETISDLETTYENKAGEYRATISKMLAITESSKI